MVLDRVRLSLCKSTTAAFGKIGNSGMESVDRYISRISMLWLWTVGLELATETRARLKQIGTN